MLFLPDCSTVIRDAPRPGAGAPRNVFDTPRHIVCAPRHVVGAPRIVAGANRCCQVHQNFTPALWGVPKLITICPMVLLYQSSEIRVTPKAGRNALLGSDTLLKLTHLHQQNVKWFGSHNSTTQLFWTATLILPEAPRHSWTGWMQNNELLRYSEMTSSAPQRFWSSGTESKNILKSMKSSSECYKIIPLSW